MGYAHNSLLPGVTFVFLFLTSCAISAPYSVRKIQDDFDNETIYAMDGNLLSPIRWAGGVELNAVKTVTPNLVVYALHLEWESLDWLFIKTGESLVLLVDDTRVGLVTQDIGRKYKPSENIGGMWTTAYCEESGLYPINWDLLVKIANAKSVRLKIVGDNGQDTQSYLDEKNFSNLKQFIEEYPARQEKK